METDLTLSAAATLTDDRGKAWRLSLAPDHRVKITAPTAFRVGTLDPDELAEAIALLRSARSQPLRAATIKASELAAHSIPSNVIPPGGPTAATRPTPQDPPPGK